MGTVVRKTIIGALAGVATIGLLTSGCGSAALTPDQAGLEYNAGPISSTKFDQCVGIGKREWHGPGDHIYSYPAGQRAYEFSTKDSADSKPINIVSKDNLTMSVEGVAYFSLNTECSTLRKFHERIGIKFHGYEEDGWKKLLGTYFRQPLERTMENVAKQYDWKQMYSDPNIKKQWEQTVGSQMVGQINNTAGGQFFCAANYSGSGPCGAFSLTLQQPDPPQSVQLALAASQEAKEQAEAQKNRNFQVDQELQSLRKLEAVLGPNATVFYMAMKRGDIKIIPLPTGGNINVTP
jgi:SPFH domain / Band 7 family